MNPDPNTRRKSQIKEQIASEIARKVREALDTPPAERIRRKQLEAAENRRRLNNERINNDLNAHLNFKEQRERTNVWMNKYGPLTKADATASNQQSQWNDSTQTGKLQNAYSDEKSANKFEYWLKPHYETQRERANKAGGIIWKLPDDGDYYDDNKPEEGGGHFRTGFDAMQNFGSLTFREKEVLLRCFTKEGFKEAMRLGRLPDGSKLEQLSGGQYRDKYGVVRDADGPFWPSCVGPMYPNPVHKGIPGGEGLDEEGQTIAEPLRDHIDEKSDYNSNSNSTFLNKYPPTSWKYMQIVFDSERSPRNQRPPHYSKEKVAPCLMFESRFESGNLRQVRRVGQFEYELILKHDLFTKRHTQWFYFRVHNMVKGATYKFVIVNLLKPTSLYMEGMRMLLYSDKKCHSENIGWYRTGHHIRYSRNVTRLQSPLLFREMAHFQLEFQIEFPYHEDMCYFAHCYPYNFSDLKNDIKELQNSNKHNYLKREVLCETKLGNSCFLLNITDPEIPEQEKSPVIISGRVHPGESNASWMMKGLLEFLMGADETASTLRKRLSFYIIPMLNPDGVIVGNYRCSIAGRDLNRNYRNPREESFPTIYYTKKLAERLKNEYDNIVLYCDLHGHSRKHNVFMYGCDSQYTNATDFNEIKPVLNLETIQEFVRDRIFPWLMQKQNPSMFSFTGCQFKIRRCKVSTGRVVMWRQFDISDSYTLETTFSGSDVHRKHFSTIDLENVGKHLCGALHVYLESMENQILERELGMEVLKCVLKQMVSKSKALATALKRRSLAKQEILKSEENKETEDQKTKTDYTIEPHSISAVNTSQDDEEINFDAIINNLTVEDVQKVKSLNISLDEIEEDSSSDSDSESEPEEIIEEPRTKTTPIVKVRKKKKKSKNLFSDTPNRKSIFKRASTKYLPSIVSTNETKIPNNPTAERRMSKTFSDSENSCNSKQIQIKLPLFVSKFDGRSNGGIPCFSEERLMERARKKSLSALKSEIEKAFCFTNTHNNHESNDEPFEIPEHLLSQYQYNYQLYYQQPSITESLNNSLNINDKLDRKLKEDNSEDDAKDDKFVSKLPEYKVIPPKPRTRMNIARNSISSYPVSSTSSYDLVNSSSANNNILSSHTNNKNNDEKHAVYPSCRYAPKMKATIYSDGPSVTVKQTRGFFRPIINKKLLKQCSINDKSHMTPSDYVMWLNNLYRRLSIEDNK